ncbi:hypothetical protein H5410_064893 [Solanum commersonii]|uniref:Uncharacterized protein n=1 Tax=Solanum commersonii TaxID=4109 RepID=A0A9J5VYQ4_SOLCO|nr:hypothetical protein H5410_064893 [Solanum commersonii]
MVSLIVLIHHSGEWDSTNNFVNYSMDGVVITTNIDFNRFTLLISSHLNVDTSLNSFEFHYKIDENSMPMWIRNTMGLQVYIELKKGSGNFKDYPLCITWKAIDIHHTLSTIGEEYEECVNEDCTWKLKCSALHKSKIFKVRRFIAKHTCPAKDRLMSQRVATSTILGRVIQYKYHDPKVVYNARDIIIDMNKQFGLDLTYWKAHRAKFKALKMVRGDPTESYAEIPRYLHMLTQSNPGSIISLQKIVDGHFQYAFVALNSSIQGWINCRPVVIVDGSFLKAAYHGTFLTASCQDAGAKYESILADNLEIALHMMVTKCQEDPKKKRQERAWKSTKKTYKTSCGKCGQEGNNMRTCRNMPKEK